MSFKVTLDDIAKAAEKKFGNVEIDLDESTVVVLRNPLRLSEKEREQIKELQDSLNSEGEDMSQEDGLREMLLLVADSKSKARRLLDSFDGDLTKLVALFQMYQEHAQTGEASPSQD